MESKDYSHSSSGSYIQNTNPQEPIDSQKPIDSTSTEVRSSKSLVLKDGQLVQRTSEVSLKIIESFKEESSEDKSLNTHTGKPDKSNKNDSSSKSYTEIIASSSENKLKEREIMKSSMGYGNGESHGDAESYNDHDNYGDGTKNHGDDDYPASPTSYGTGYGEGDDYSAPPTSYGTGYGKGDDYSAPPTSYGKGYGVDDGFSDSPTNYGKGYGVDDGSSNSPTSYGVDDGSSASKNSQSSKRPSNEKKPIYDKKSQEEILNLCFKTLNPMENQKNVNFEYSEKAKDYMNGVIISVKSNPYSIEKLGSGDNKTIHKVDGFVEGKFKSFAVSEGTYGGVGKGKFLTTEINLIKEISEMNLKGAVKTYGVLLNEDKTKFFIISKTANAGTLGGYLQKVDDKTGLSLLFDGFDCVKEFHKNDIYHGDIKLSNFLVHKGKKGDVKVKINDFGCSIIDKKIKGERLHSFLLLDPYTMKDTSSAKNNIDSYQQSDKYAYGLAICEFLRRNNKNKIDTDLSHLSNDEIRNLKQNMCPWLINKDMTDDERMVFVSKFIDDTPFSEDLPELKELVKQLMAYKPEDRPSDDEIHAAIQQIREKL